MGKNVNVQTSMGIIISVSDNFQIFQFKLINNYGFLEYL